jgi:hypothetical protein
MYKINICPWYNLKLVYQKLEGGKCAEEGADAGLSSLFFTRL